jgi:hypothetical protein
LIVRQTRNAAAVPGLGGTQAYGNDALRRKLIDAALEFTRSPPAQ